MLLLALVRPVGVISLAAGVGGLHPHQDASKLRRNSGAGKGQYDRRVCALRLSEPDYCGEPVVTRRFICDAVQKASSTFAAEPS